MDIYTVYCHTSPNGKRYVGISNNPIKRWNNGNGYIKNYRFYPDIEKYGWNNIKHEILYSNISFEYAKQLEKQLIKQWNLTNPLYGYNLREGGDGPLSFKSRRLLSISLLKNKNSLGRKLSAETKQKISSSLKSYYKIHNGSFYNRHHSQETINKLKNRIVSDETKKKMSINHANVNGANNPSAKPIRQLDLNGNIIKEYSYAKLAATTLNIDLSSIIKCCKGKQKTAGGYKWEYIIT